MQNFNHRQRSVVWIALTLAAVMLLLPPVVSPGHYETQVALDSKASVYVPSARGYGFLFSEDGEVDKAQLLIQLLVLGALSWAAVTSLQKR